jgi:hypothetical protein
MNASLLSSETVEASESTGPYSRTEHLARSILLGRFDWSSHVAMYSAYFDESGHPDDSPRVIVAGCIADIRQWVHFEREWKEILTPLGIEVFHAADFDRRKPPFDLPDTKASELLERLVGIIVRRVEKTVACAVPMLDYKAMNERYLLAEYFGFPYPCAARSCLAFVEAWANQHSFPYHDILCFFEDGAKHKGQLEWMAERDGFPSPTFKKKSEVTPLQAGDLLAWLHTKMFGRTGISSDRYAMATVRLESMSHHWFERHDFKDADAMATNFAIPIREANKSYRCQIIKRDGRRRALVRVQSLRGGKQHKLVRSTIVVSELPPHNNPR